MPLMQPLMEQYRQSSLIRTDHHRGPLGEWRDPQARASLPWVTYGVGRFPRQHLSKGISETRKRALHSNCIQEGECAKRPFTSGGKFIIMQGSGCDVEDRHAEQSENN